MVFEDLKNGMLFSGLYQDIKLNEHDYEGLSMLLLRPFTFDAYCECCEMDSVFSVAEKETLGPKMVKVCTSALYDADEKECEAGPRIATISHLAERYPYVRIDAVCSRCGNTIKFYFRLTNDSIQKIGQYPSIATLEKKEIKKYRSILSTDYSEFSKAIGLYSHGIGIGSYVYLRRIIERLIEKAHQTKTNEAEWDEEAYQRSHIGERIDTLSDVIDNDAYELLKPLYSILSKGIHELNENECIENFGFLQTAIELILDEELAKLNKAAKIKKAKSDLGTIKGKML